MPLGSPTPGSLFDPRQRHHLTLRAFYLPLALLVSFALVAQLFVTIARHDLTTTTRIIRMLSFFTIQSNALVCATSWGLVLRPQRAGPLWRVLRVDAIAGIAVTGVVYSIALSGLQHLHGWARFCDNVFHYIVPIATVGGWLLFGPRGRVDRQSVLLGLIWPLLWFGYTLVHGAISGWYPYHFIDVGKIGYPQALVNAFVVMILLGIVLSLIWVVDQRAGSLTGRGVRQRVRRPKLRRSASG
jgi:TRAP-type C4-dicarboxylate transport system permease small subunit